MYLYKSCFDIIYTVVNNSCEDTSDSGYVPYDSQVYYGQMQSVWSTATIEVATRAGT